jgi:hypothetical protein
MDGAPGGAPRQLVAGVRRLLARGGYDLVRLRPGSPELQIPVDFDGVATRIVKEVQPYTLTGPERIYSLCEAVRYIVRVGVPGAIAECGVWRGGSMLAVIRTLQDLGVTDRELWFYDTFDAMPEGGSRDIDLDGVTAAEQHQWVRDGGAVDPCYDYLPYEEVRAMLLRTGYPAERMHFVQGLVEETIPGEAPERIALLRLDTDYYESTKHELVHLYPRIGAGGVLIVDDYGHWRGSREAVDEYIAEHRLPLLLQRIDYTARLAIAPG